jgi:hypothetical protein
MPWATFRTLREGKHRTGLHRGTRIRSLPRFNWTWRAATGAGHRYSALDIPDPT